MNAHTQVAPSALQISNISVRQDDQGRYCLNDLHKAAGGQKNHQPSNWLRTQQTQDLIAEIPHIRGIDQKKGVGTFAVKELAISYAMWISASFSLKVIRAYDALQSQPYGNSEQLPKPDAHDPVRSRVLVVVEGDTVNQSIVPANACIVIPDNTASLHTFINEMVPLQHIQLVFELASRRILLRHQASLKQPS